MTLIVNRQQQLLHEILGFLGQPRHPSAQERSQVRREFAQKKVVRRCVADETTDQKASKALFFQLHLNLFNSSLEMTIWLQSPHSSPRAARGSVFVWFASNLKL